MSESRNTEPFGGAVGDVVQPSSANTRHFVAKRMVSEERQQGLIDVEKRAGHRLALATLAVGISLGFCLGFAAGVGG